jgi:hypothetical protein
VDIKGISLTCFGASVLFQGEQNARIYKPVAIGKLI